MTASEELVAYLASTGRETPPVLPAGDPLAWQWNPRLTKEKRLALLASPSAR